MFTLGVLVAHLLGDYVLQNDYMAYHKTKSFLMAFLHGWIQGILLILVVVWFYPDLSFGKTMLIFGITTLTHTVIDRWRLVKPLIWFINQVGGAYSYQEGMAHAGYSKEKPAWMATWLMIIFDNTLHLTITFVTLMVVLR